MTHEDPPIEITLFDIENAIDFVSMEPYGVNEAFLSLDTDRRSSSPNSEIRTNFPMISRSQTDTLRSHTKMTSIWESNWFVTSSTHRPQAWRGKLKKIFSTAVRMLAIDRFWMRTTCSKHGTHSKTNERRRRFAIGVRKTNFHYHLHVNSRGDWCADLTPRPSIAFVRANCCRLLCNCLPLAGFLARIATCWVSARRAGNDPSRGRSFPRCNPSWP